jgi:hypothetical protein
VQTVNEEAKSLLREVTRFYLDSGDFNGIPALQLADRLKKPWESMKPIVVALIEEELIGILDASSDVNPAIIRVGFEPKEVQIQKLDNPDLRHVYIYPRTAHLNQSWIHPLTLVGRMFWNWRLATRSSRFAPLISPCWNFIEMILVTVTKTEISMGQLVFETNFIDQIEWPKETKFFFNHSASRLTRI